MITNESEEMQNSMRLVNVVSDIQKAVLNVHKRNKLDSATDLTRRSVPSL